MGVILAEGAIIMTKFAGMCLSLRCHSSESLPAWMQVVEPRLEQAAEESRKALPGYY